MSNLAALNARLQREASYQSSEGFDDKLNGWLSDAIAQHSPDYTSDNLPDAQDTPVVLLAWISLCFARASKWVNIPNTQGAAGYGTDRDSPYRKNMDMAAQLQKRYDYVVEDLANDDPLDTISQGRLVIRSAKTDRVGGYSYSPRVRTLLTAEAVGSDNVILKFIFARVQDFADTYIYHQTTPGIFQDWNNLTDDGVPYHSDAATLVAKIADQNQQALRIADLTPLTDNYFIVAIRTFTGKTYYSNEIRVDTVAP